MRALPLFAALACAASLAFAEDPKPEVPLEERLKAAGAKEQSVETGEVLAGEPGEGDGVETRAVLLKGADIPANFFIGDNGTKLFLADRSGVIRKITLPTWKEERRLWIGKPVTGIARCKEGILATVPDKKQLLLVNADTLDVSYHWMFEEVPTVYAMPGGGHAWIPKYTNGRPTDLQVIEQVSHALQPTISSLALIQAHAAQGSYERNPGSRQLSTFENLTVSPKSDWLMLTSSDCVFRLRENGPGLLIEEAGAPMGKLTHIAVSPDSNQIAVASPAPENMPEGWPAMKKAGSLIFKSKDLSKPVAAVEGIDIWGFSKSSDRVWGFRDDGKFVVQTVKGKIERSVELGPTTGVLDAKQTGDALKFVLHLGDRIAWVWFK